VQAKRIILVHENGTSSLLYVDVDMQKEKPGDRYPLERKVFARFKHHLKKKKAFRRKSLVDAKRGIYQLLKVQIKYQSRMYSKRNCSG